MLPIESKLWLVSQFLLLFSSSAWQLHYQNSAVARRRQWRLSAKSDKSHNNEGENKFSPFGRTQIEHGPHQLMKQVNGDRQQKQQEQQQKKQNSVVKLPESGLITTDSKTMKRDRALVALHSNLKMDMVEAMNLLEKFPELYLDCPSLATRISYLLQELGLSKKKLRHILQVHPRLMVRVLLDDPETNVSSTMEILQTELQMSLEEIMAKKLWQLDRMEMKPRLSLLKEMIPSVVELKNLCLKHPNVLGCVAVPGNRQTTTSSNMKQILRILQQDVLQLSQEQVGEMIRTQPSILLEDPARIHRQAHFLLHGAVGEGLGMVLRRGESTQNMETLDEQQKLVLQRVQELLLRFPVLLTSPNVMVTVDYILGLGCTTYDLGRIAYRRPKLFQYDVDAIQEKVNYFCRQLGSTDDDDDRIPVLDMMATAPDVFTQSITANLDPKLQYFRQELGLDTVALRSILFQRPQVLCLSLTDNLIPKIQYLSGTFQMKMEDVRKMITLYPQVLRESLETRIEPRCQLILQLGLRCPEHVPLDFLQMTDARWTTWVAVGFDENRLQDVSMRYRKMRKGKTSANT